MPRVHPRNPDTEATSWREVEVELTEHGGVDQLDRIEKQLLEAGARRSGSASKLSRVLADRLADNADHPDEPGTAGTAVLAYLHDQTDTLRRYDPLVRQDAPDSVHKMRVASRRLHSAMQAYRRVLDRDITAPLTEELKWLAGELAPARNTEVMAERFAKMVDTLPAELVLGPVSATLVRTLTRRQAQARERALAALDSDRYLALHDAIDMLLADPPLTRTASQPAHRELPTSVRRAHRRLRRRMAEVDQRPAGAARDLALHEARKAAKRLRYATETAEPAVGKPATRLRKHLPPRRRHREGHDRAVAPPGRWSPRGHPHRSRCDRTAWASASSGLPLSTRRGCGRSSAAGTPRRSPRAPEGFPTATGNRGRSVGVGQACQPRLWPPRSAARRSCPRSRPTSRHRPRAR
jgi:CHAD domain-containing protein